jgi:superfamily II DNA or RNA helicase
MSGQTHANIKMQKRKYQLDAIEYLKNTKRALLIAPAGSGKTYMAASAVNRLIGYEYSKNMWNVPTVEVMVNTTEQKQQMQDAFDRFRIGKRCNLHIYCAAGAPMDTDPDLLIVDECHHSTAKTWKQKIAQCTAARWGLSATPFEGKDPDQVKLIKKLFSAQPHIIKRDQLVAKGNIAPALVKWLTPVCPQITPDINDLADELTRARRKKMPWFFKSEDKAREQESQCRWQAALKIGIHDNPLRDLLIIDTANMLTRQGKHVIVLIASIEHGKILHEYIYKSKLCYSKMGAKKRRETIAEFRAGGCKCLIATSMLDEGFDAPIADALILAYAGKSQRRAIQSTGRVLRPYKGKECGLIYDFKDTFNGMLANQARKRRAMYKQLNYSQEG